MNEALENQRARNIGELIMDTDVVLLNKRFARLGFHTECCWYYAGNYVTPAMMPIITTVKDERPKPPKS